MWVYVRCMCLWPWIHMFHFKHMWRPEAGCLSPFLSTLFLTLGSCWTWTHWFNWACWPVNSWDLPFFTPSPPVLWSHTHHHVLHLHGYFGTNLGFYACLVDTLLQAIFWPLIIWFFKVRFIIAPPKEIQYKSNLTYTCNIIYRKILRVSIQTTVVISSNNSCICEKVKGHSWQISSQDFWG